MGGGVAGFEGGQCHDENARELQDRERRLEKKSVAALLSADLHRKLILLVHLLQGPEADRLRELATMDIAMSSKALEAALPKLGDLGHQGAANMFAAFDGIAQLVSDARGEGRARQGLTERMQCVALHVGRVVNTLGRLYKLDQPEPLEKAGMNLKAVGLEVAFNGFLDPSGRTIMLLFLVSVLAYFKRLR